MARSDEELIKVALRRQSGILNQIVERIFIGTRHSVLLTPPRLYQAITRLLADGQITLADNPDPANPRKIYIRE